MPEGSGTTTADQSGNGNTGTFASSGHPAWTSTVPSFGVSGSAPFAVVGDATSYINTGNTTVVQNGNAVTVVAWIYPTSNTAYGAERVVDVNGNEVFGVNLNGNTNQDVAFKVTGSTNLIRDSVSSAYALNTWTFVAWTWDGSTTAANAHIYTATVGSPTVTEVSYATTTNGVTLTSNTGNSAVILNRTSDSARAFLGNVAEVGIFNSILSTSDLQNIFNRGLTATVPSNNKGGGFFLFEKHL